MITENICDEKLLQSIRLLNTEQKERLLLFIDSITNSSPKKAITFSNIIEKIRTEAEQNNLTEELLAQILSEEH